MHDVVRHLDPALVVLAHEGTRRYEELYDLVYRREASKPNEIWQADHTRLDLWVITPAGHSARPWLTVIEDDHSRAVAGYGLNLGAPSALNTALAFRQAIWRKEHPDWYVCGIPAPFHVDHGSDFTSRHLNDASSHAAAVGSRVASPIFPATAADSETMTEGELRLSYSGWQ